jgi:hypothetical protein
MNAVTEILYVCPATQGPPYPFGLTAFGDQSVVCIVAPGNHPVGPEVHKLIDV